MSGTKKTKAKPRPPVTDKALQLQQAAFLLRMAEKVVRAGRAVPLKFITLPRSLIDDVAAQLKRGNRQKGGAQ